MSKPRPSVVKSVLGVQAWLRNRDRSPRRLVPLMTDTVQAHRDPTKPRHRPRLLRKARASLVLLGRQIGYMRQLKPRQKAQVRKIRETKGVRKAIVQARRFAAFAH